MRRDPRAGARHEHCRELLLEIARGLEDDLPPPERRALARHLRACRRCGTFSDGLRRTVALCRSLGRETLTGRTLARARANAALLLAQTPRKTPRARRRAPGRSPSRG